MIKIVIPENLQHIAPDIEAFFNGMVGKLSANAFKGVPDRSSVRDLYAGMMSEIDEAFEQFVKDQHDPNMLLELCDISNYSFLFYLAINRRMKDEQRKAWLETTSPGKKEA